MVRVHYSFQSFKNYYPRFGEFCLTKQYIYQLLISFGSVSLIAKAAVLKIASNRVTAVCGLESHRFHLILDYSSVWLERLSDTQEVPSSNLGSPTS